MYTVIKLGDKRLGINKQYPKEFGDIFASTLLELDVKFIEYRSNEDKQAIESRRNILEV